MNKFPMTDVMFDLETLSSNADAAIIQIGAIAFNLQEFGPHYKATINFDDALKYGKASGSTIKWWMQQSDAARRSVTEVEGQSLVSALQGFNGFISGLPEGIKVWSHATFDVPVIMSAYQATGVARGLKYKSCLDLRTLELHYGDLIQWDPREGTHHDALEDALWQAKHAQLMLRRADTDMQRNHGNE